MANWLRPPVRSGPAHPAVDAATQAHAEQPAAVAPPAAALPAPNITAAPAITTRGSLACASGRAMSGPARCGNAIKAARTPPTTPAEPPDEPRRAVVNRATGAAASTHRSETAEAR